MKQFFRLQFRNYMIGSLIAIFGVGGSLLFLTSTLTWRDMKILSITFVISLCVMFICEFYTFIVHVQPLLHVSKTNTPTFEELRSAYIRMRKFPLLSVQRIMGPHWLGLSIPGASITLVEYRITHIPLFGVTEVSIACMASFCVASMHALIEFYFTSETIVPVLKALRTSIDQHFPYHTKLQDTNVISIRTKLVVSALLLGTLPLLLFSAAVQLRIMNGLHFGFFTYLQWSITFLLTGIGFSVLAALLITRAIQKPISDIQTAIQTLREGNLNTYVENDYLDEFSQLASGFNEMTSTLKNRETENHQLIDSYFATLATALDARDPYTAGHSIRVAQYAVEIGKELHFNFEELELIRKSAILHDIGKLGVRDSVLLKDGKLTEEEYEQIKKHPVIGEEILKQIEPIEAMLPLLPGVRSHHERFDGKGYPDGLRGQEIPQLGRIIAVADAFDAMTSNRPYRQTMSVLKAKSIIAEGAGTQWDPQFTNAFLCRLETISDLSDWNKETTIHLFPLEQAK